MNILYYGVFDNEIRRAEYPMAEGLQQLGNHLYCSNYRQVSNILKDWKKREKQIDLVFLQNGKGFPTELLKLFKNIPFVYFASEAELKYALPVLNSTCPPSLVIAHSLETLSYCQQNHIPAIRLHNGYNPQYYYCINNHPYLYDVCFVGNQSSRRLDIINFLHNYQIRLMALTSNNPEKINLIYNQSKIALHIHMIEQAYLPSRLFEIMPTRACLLIEDMQKEFDPNIGENFFEIFKNKEDLKKKILYLLENNNYRHSLVSNAHEYAKNHSWQKRMVEFNLAFQQALNNFVEK